MIDDLEKKCDINAGYCLILINSTGIKHSFKYSLAGQHFLGKRIREGRIPSSSGHCGPSVELYFLLLILHRERSYYAGLTGQISRFQTVIVCLMVINLLKKKDMPTASQADRKTG